MRVLITGAAGFIGFHLSMYLLKRKFVVYGVDTLNSYYDKKLKISRLNILKKNPKFKFKKLGISNKKKINNFFDKNKVEIIINLAAYAGVQYSLKNPDKYFKTNEIGFYNLLENAKRKKIKKVLFASSSSVAGDLKKNLFSEDDITDFPISLYAATKKNNEILAHFYAKNYKIKIIGIRFFTVYGSFGRPDLSIYKFAKLIQNNKPITINNFGNHYRDFTYIDDAIKCVFKLLTLRQFHKKEKLNNPYFQIFNLGGGKKIKITKIVSILEKYLNKKAKINMGPLKKGDIISSQSDISKLKRNIKYFPNTTIDTGLKKFVEWFIKIIN